MEQTHLAMRLAGDNDIERVLHALRAMRPPLITQEVDLQGLVARALESAGVPFSRERQLAPKDRIDFLAAGGVGIECKKGKPNNTRLQAQVERYCASPEVTAIIVVTPWRRHLHLPERIREKPCQILSLNQQWGIAL